MHISLKTEHIKTDDVAIRAASVKVRVIEGEYDGKQLWVVTHEGRPDTTFPKHQFHRSVAETYADGLALRIAARNKARD